MTLHCTALCYVILYRYITVLHCTALHCTALHCTALHCTALMSHCTALMSHCTDTSLHLFLPTLFLIPSSREYLSHPCPRRPPFLALPPSLVVTPFSSHPHSALHSSLFTPHICQCCASGRLLQPTLQLLTLMEQRGTTSSSTSTTSTTPSSIGKNTPSSTPRTTSGVAADLREVKLICHALATPQGAPFLPAVIDLLTGGSSARPVNASKWALTAALAAAVVGGSVPSTQVRGRGGGSVSSSRASQCQCCDQAVSSSISCQCHCRYLTSASCHATAVILLVPVVMPLLLSY